MLWNWLTPKTKVSLACSSEEREAVYRFVYSVYGQEKRFVGDFLDHENKVIRDEDNDSPYAHHVYAGEVDDIKGAGRILIWPPGEIPEKFFESYSMHKFPGIQERTVAEISRLCVSAGFRGKLVLPSMALFAYDYMAGEHGVDLSFGCCRPSLMKHYRRLGARPYGGRLMHGDQVGVCIPYVTVLSDTQYLSSVGALIASRVSAHFGDGKRPPVDQSAFASAFDEDNSGIQFSTERVWDALDDFLSATPECTPSLGDHLEPRFLRKLAGSGYLLSFSKGDSLVREGIAERELYVLRGGSVEVLRGETPIAVMGAGDVFGEMAFFRSSGLRTATVRALEDGEVLVIPYGFVEKLRESNPEAACDLLLYLGTLLSYRLHQAPSEASRAVSYE